MTINPNTLGLKKILGRFDWVKQNQEVIVSHGQNVTVDVTIGSKCHSGRSEHGRNVQAAYSLIVKKLTFKLSLGIVYLTYLLGPWAFCTAAVIKHNWSPQIICTAIKTAKINIKKHIGQPKDCVSSAA